MKIQLELILADINKRLRALEDAVRPTPDGSSEFSLMHPETKQIRTVTLGEFLVAVLEELKTIGTINKEDLH